MSAKRYTSTQTARGRVIFDNHERRYVSTTATGDQKPPALTADIDRAEVWTVWTEGERATFKGILQGLNKQPWLEDDHSNNCGA